MLSTCGVGEDSWEKTPERWLLRLEKTPEVKPVNPKGNQPWIFFESTDAETKASMLWPPDTETQLIGKDPDAWNDWEQEEKGTTEDEMVG